MRTRGKIILIVSASVLALGVVAAVAGPLIYRDYIAAPAAEVPTLTADDDTLEGAETSEALDPSELTGTWSLSEGSVAGYRVDEVLNGTDVTVTGRTSEVSGEFTVDALSLQAATITVDVASISTDESNRDRYFREQALQTDEYPTATFVLTEPVTAAEAPASGQATTHQLTGDLTLAGVTRSVTVEVQARTDGRTAELVGQIPITFSDFGITAPDLGFVSVEDSGFVEFELVAERS